VSITIHLPHWVLYVLGGFVCGLIAMFLVLAAAIRDAIGRGLW
jgi:hypothetical protein